MNKLDYYDFKKEYIRWLEANITVNELAGNKDRIIEIITPFLNSNNDKIIIYVKKKEAGLFLTDAGSTVNELELSGVDLSNDKRKILLQSFVNAYGVSINNDELCTSADYSNFPQKKHSLLQAILSIDDMFMISQHRVSGMFLDDVIRTLDAHGISYVEKVAMNGKSGLYHNIELIIPKSKLHPQRPIKLFNKLTKDKAQSTMFTFNDIRESKTQIDPFVIINDLETKPKDEILAAFKNNDINVLLKSNLDQTITSLIN